MQQRLAFLDNIKAFSIILVVFCHYTTLNSESFVGNVIMSLAWAAVPLFFMVSGILSNMQKTWVWKKYLIRLLKTYSVLCIWKLVYFVVFYLNYDLAVSKIDIIKYIFLFGSIEGIADGVLWFMYAYLEILLLSPVLWSLWNHSSETKKIFYFVTFLVLFNGVLINSLNFITSLICDFLEIGPLNWSGLSKIIPFSGYNNMIFYYLLGTILFQYSDCIEIYLRKKQIFLTFNNLLFLFIIIGLVGLVSIKYIDTGSFLWSGIYLTNGYQWISTIFLSIGIFLTFKKISNFSILNEIGKLLGSNTLGIYYIHYLLLPFIQNGFIFLFGLSFFSNCLKTVIVILPCLIISLLLKKIPIVKNLVS